MLQISLDLPSEAKSVPLCRRLLRTLLRDLAVDQERAYAIELVLSEAAANVVCHAYEQAASRYAVKIVYDDDRLRLQVTDHGRGLDAAIVPDPTEERVGGRGLWLIEQLADAVKLETPPGGGCVVEAEFSFAIEPNRNSR
jgi:serine/threonine-protein kinase RsbW